MICSKGYIANPYMLAKLIEVSLSCLLDYFYHVCLPQVVFVVITGTHHHSTRMIDMFAANSLTQSHFAPALMRIYVGVLLCVCVGGDM